MKEYKFITICLLCCGAILIAQSAFTMWLQSGVATAIFHLFTGLIIVAAGIDRWRLSETTDHSSSQYSLQTYMIAVLSAFLTLIFIGEVRLIY